MNKKQVAQKTFEMLSFAIRASAKFNNEKHAVKIEYGKFNKNINDVLKLIGYENNKQKLIDRIKIAAEKIADDVVYDMKNSDTSLVGSINSITNNISTASNALDGRMGLLQGVLFAQQNLLHAMHDAVINRDLSAKIQKTTSETIDVLNLPKAKLNDITTALKNTSDLTSALQQYVDDMQLPTWFAEIFLRKTSNLLVAGNNSSAANSLHTSFKDLSNKIHALQHNLDDGAKAQLQDVIAQQNVLESKISKIVQQSDYVSDAMESNNELLARIENDTSYKRNQMQKVVNTTKEFINAAQEAVVLRYVRDKFSEEEFNNLKTVISNIPKYFESINDVKNYQYNVKHAFDLISASIDHLKTLEKSINAHTKTATAFYNIEQAMHNINVNLDKQVKSIEKQGSSAIPEEMLCWERSGWQKFKNFFANASQFIIGEDLHVTIYGHPSGVEMVRRAAEKIVDNVAIQPIEMIDIDVLEGQIFAC